MVRKNTDSLILNAATLTEVVSEALAPSLRAAGLSQSNFDLLLTVRSAAGAASQVEIARRLGVMAPTLSESVRGLVANGWLEQKADDGDKRVKTLVITAEGSRRLRKVMTALELIEKELSTGFSAAEMATVNAILKKATKNLALRVALEQDSA